MMRSRILSYLLAGLFSLWLMVPDATATVTINASPASLAQLSTVTATWSGIVNPTATDWIALARVGAAIDAYPDWIYVSCTKSAGSAAAAGTCSYVVPFWISNGTYELRLFANNVTTNLLATSNPFTVGPSNSPVVTIAVTDATATEGTPADTGVFTVSRTGSTTAALTVNYTVGGTATNGTDYQTLTGSVVIGVGQSSAPITVTTIDDNLAEGNETVIVTLSANAAYTVGAPASGTVTISDDEPVVSIAVTDGTATEGTPADTGVFTVSRTGSTTAALTVNYTVGGTATNGTDYQTLTGTVVIPAGQSSAPITVTTINDNLAEGNETVIVTLSANAAYAVGAPSSGTVTIVDDEPAPGPSISASPAVVAQSSAVTTTWSGIVNPTATDWIALAAVGAANNSYPDWVYVSCTKSAGSAAASGTCPFVVPSWISNGTYELRLFANNVTTNRLATSNPFTVGPSNLPVVTIAVTDATATEGTPADTGVFSVSRTGSTTAALTVNYAVSGTATNGTDYQTLTGSVVIGVGQSSAPITVTTIDDNLAEGDETVIVTLSANAAYTVGTPASGTVTIKDDEPPLPAVTITPATVSVMENNGSGTSLTVSRTGVTTAALQVFYSVGGTATAGADYASLTGSVTLGVGQPSVTINIVPVNDTAVEGDETVIVTLTAMAGVYSLGASTSSTVTIVDDDVPAGPSLIANPSSIAAGSNLTVTWSGIASPTSTDWIGLYPAGSTSNFLAWMYVSCTTTAGSALAAGSCPLKLDANLASGTYELRLFAHNSTTIRLATSNSIVVAPVVIGSSTLAATLGVFYSQGLSATGGTGPYTWSQVGGSVPGLNLSSAGVLSGTPTQSGNNFSFTAKAVDSLGASATRLFTVVVSPSSVLAIASSVLPSAQVNVSYAFNLGATGGTAPYTYSIPSGGLPLGLSLSSSGVISGIPYSIGSTKFVVQVKDSVNATASATLILTAQSSGRKPLRGYWSFDDGTATDNSGFNPGSTLVGSPAVVPGISGNALRFDGASQYVNASDFDLDAGSGELSLFAWVRTIQTGGLKMIVAQRDSSSSTNPGYQLFQNSNNALSYIIGDLNGSVVRQDSTGPQINDGNWHFVGVVFNRNATHTGVLYVDGQPAINGTGDITSVVGTNVAAQGIPLRIGAEYHTTPTYLWNGDIDEVSVFTRRFFTDPEALALYNRTLTITSDTLPAGGVNANYNQRLVGTGGVAPYTWSLSSGALPAGLSPLTPDGVLTGTPTASGTFNFTVRLTDALGTFTQQPFTLTINNQQQLLKDDFSGGTGNWHVVDQGTAEGPANWVIHTPDFVQTSNTWDGNFLGSDPTKPGTFAFYTGSLASLDYDFSVRMMSEDNDALGVMFRYQDSNNYYRFSMDSERRYRRLVKVVGGVTTILKKSDDLTKNAEDNVPYELGQVYNVRVSVVGSDIFVYIDNHLILHAIDSTLATGNKVALYTWGNEYSHFGDVLVTH